MPQLPKPGPEPRPFCRRPDQTGPSEGPAEDVVTKIEIKRVTICQDQMVRIRRRELDHIGRVYEALGEREGALDAYERALGFGPDAEARRSLEQRIQLLRPEAS